MKRQRRGLSSTMLLLCLVLGGGFVSAVSAQELVIPEVTYPGLPKQAASAQGFVPQGWMLEAQASGDLNRDGVPDLAFVLRQNDPKNVISDPHLGQNPFNTNPRILVVAFRSGSSGEYLLQAENHTLIPRRENPSQEDPFEGGIAIERGGLRVTLGLFMNAGGWEMFSATHTFQYRNSRFELIGYDRSSVHRASGETHDISANYLTGKIKLSVGNISNDNPTKVMWRILPQGARPTLDTMGDGLDFDPKH